ncbi:MAG: hypothetical protein AB8B53_10365 [Flavobacteriales bacterium]
MNRQLFYILFSLGFALSAVSCTIAQSEEKIYWEKDLKFDWDLFKEKKNSYSYFKALTFSGIMYEVEVVNELVDIKVSSYFIYGKSWVMKGYKKPYLLEHEKMHFHIAELYKRKLEAICKKYRVDHRTFVNRGFDKALQRDFDRIFNEMEAYQNKYDKETEHGTKRKTQLEWEAKLKEELGI